MNMEKESDVKYSVPMVAKAMELLEILSVHPNGLSLQEMVQLLNYPKTTVYKMACTLWEKGYLGRDKTERTFYLSKKLLQLGLASLDERSILEQSVEHMKNLRDELKESVMLGTIINNEVVLLKQVVGSYDFVFTLKQGMKFNLFSTAPGKVLLAYQTTEELLENVEFYPINNKTISRRSVLEKELKQIRKQGYAADLEETMKGVHCVAAPIFNMDKEAIACVWISGPSGRLLLDDIQKKALQIIECANKISRNIGYINL